MLGHVLGREPDAATVGDGADGEGAIVVTTLDVPAVVG
jgi:hypothetical protein